MQIKMQNDKIYKTHIFRNIRTALLKIYYGKCCDILKRQLKIYGPPQNCGPEGKMCINCGEAYKLLGVNASKI